MTRFIAQTKEKISQLFLKYKWAFWSFFAVVLAILIKVLFSRREERSELTEQLTKIVTDKKAEMLQTAISQNQQAVKKAEEEVKEVDTVISHIEEEKERTVERIDGMSLRELNNEFKSLGY